MFTDERKSVVNELKAYNLPFSVATYNELVNAIVPIDLSFSGQISRFPDYIENFKSDSLYHSSSIPSLAINDFWGPLRQRRPTHDLESVLHPLVIFKRANILLNNIKMPFIKDPDFSGGVNKLFELNEIEESYTKKEFIHLSSPFWGPLQKAKPYHIQMNWSGSVHAKMSYSKVLEQARDF